MLINSYQLIAPSNKENKNTLFSKSACQTESFYQKKSSSSNCEKVVFFPQSHDKKEDKININYVEKNNLEKILEELKADRNDRKGLKKYREEKKKKMIQIWQSYGNLLGI